MLKKSLTPPEFMCGTFGCFSYDFPNKHARHPAYQLIFVYAESGPLGLRPASRKVPRISDSGSQSSVFDIGIIVSPMARESVCFRFLLFLSKTLVFLSSEYPELSWKIGNRDLKSAELSWNRIRISTWILKV